MRLIHVIGILGLALLPCPAPGGQASWRAHLATMDQFMDRQDLVLAKWA